MKISCDFPPDDGSTLHHASTSSTETTPYCKFYEQHLELFADRCAEWWVLLPQQQMVTKKMVCVAFIPAAIEPGQEFEIRVYVAANLPGVAQVHTYHYFL